MHAARHESGFARSGNEFCLIVYMFMSCFAFRFAYGPLLTEMENNCPLSVRLVDVLTNSGEIGSLISNYFSNKKLH